MLSSLSTSHLLLSSGAFLVTYFFVCVVILPLLSSRGKFLNSQSWIGLKKQWFAKYRGGFATLHNTREMIVEGYEKVTSFKYRTQFFC